MVCLYPLGSPVQCDFASLVDDHGEEELQSFGYPGASISHSAATRAKRSYRVRTDDDGRGLRDFTDLLILLHDALDPRLRERALGSSSAKGRRSRHTTGNFVVLFLFFIEGAVLAVWWG